MTVLYLVACGAIFWSAFCRLVLMHGATQKRVRAGFVLLGGAAGFGVASALFGGHEPDAIEVMMTASYAVVLVISAAHWRRGVPTEYLLDPGE
jgi:hypothetical protein